MSKAQKKTKGLAESWNPETMFGAGMSFAAAEAYKLLRTNIRFSFSDTKSCHVIGITSSVQNEGKSSSGCNLAFALTEAGSRVLLLEADLRKPTIASKLGLSKAPGLTNILVTGDDYKSCIQHSKLAADVDILTCGEIPPNPSELLGSGRMAQLLEQMKADYDYILVDLPPVTAVSDAVTISKILDGVVVIVRSGVAHRKALAETMRQLKMVGARILGFVYREDMLAHRAYYKHSYNRYSSYEKAENND